MSLVHRAEEWQESCGRLLRVDDHHGTNTCLILPVFLANSFEMVSTTRAVWNRRLVEVTPLHRAAMFGLVDVAMELLEAPAIASHCSASRRACMNWVICMAFETSEGFADA